MLLGELLAILDDNQIIDIYGSRGEMIELHVRADSVPTTNLFDKVVDKVFPKKVDDCLGHVLNVCLITNDVRLGELLETVNDYEFVEIYDFVDGRSKIIFEGTKRIANCSTEVDKVLCRRVGEMREYEEDGELKISICLSWR